MMPAGYVAKSTNGMSFSIVTGTNISSSFLDIIAPAPNLAMVAGENGLAMRTTGKHTSDWWRLMGSPKVTTQLRHVLPWRAHH